jgi:hypothetical protein
MHSRRYTRLGMPISSSTPYFTSLSTYGIPTAFLFLYILPLPPLSYWTIFLVHQYRRSSHVSIVSADKELRRLLTRSLAELKTRSNSADIAGIERRSRAYCRIPASIFPSLTTWAIIPLFAAKTIDNPLIKPSKESSPHVSLFVELRNSSISLIGRVVYVKSSSLSLYSSFQTFLTFLIMMSIYWASSLTQFLMNQRFR